jgi:hypothetical protein
MKSFLIKMRVSMDDQGGEKLSSEKVCGDETDFFFPYLFRWKEEEESLGDDNTKDSTPKSIIARPFFLFYRERTLADDNSFF